MNTNSTVWKKLLTVFGIAGVLSTTPIVLSCLQTPSAIVVFISVFLISGAIAAIAYAYGRSAENRTRRLAAFVLISGGLTTISKVASGLELAISAAARADSGKTELPLLFRFSTPTPLQIELILTLAAVGMIVIAYRLLQAPTASNDLRPPLNFHRIWRARVNAEICKINPDAIALDRMFRKLVAPIID
jgi:hypothetical protein